MTCYASVLLLGYSSSFIKRKKDWYLCAYSPSVSNEAEEGGGPVLKRDLVTLRVVIP